jgi:DnaD/phage-associated family protein
LTEPKIPGGYILLSRKIIESKIWDKPPLYIKVWIYLLSKAQHKKYRNLEKGQLITSIPEISKACGWLVGYRREYPSKDNIYQIIDWLRNPDEDHSESNTEPTMIATTKATQRLVITICNYSYYQDSKNYEGNDESNNEKAMNAQRKQRHTNNINKNDKNDIEEEQERIGKVYQFYQKNIGVITPFQSEVISQYLDEGMEPEMIIGVMKDGIGMDVPWKWIEKVLANCDKSNIKTLAQYEAKKVEKQRKRDEKGNKPQSGKPTFNNFTNRSYDTKKLKENLLRKSGQRTFDNFEGRQYDGKELEEAWIEKSRGSISPEYEQKEGETIEEWQKRIFALRKKERGELER